MQHYEIETIIENIKYTDRALWEQCRYMIYSNLQMNSKKQLEITDIMKFAWDEDATVEKQSISDLDIERLKEKSKHISIQIVNG